MRVSVIIPTRNEAQGIGRVLADLPFDLVTEVIVVDSKSTDGTLTACDIVVGPTHDGGFYLVGQRLLVLRFSQAVEWAPAVRWRGCYRAHEVSGFR